MENKEPNMNAYTDVMMKKAHLDWEMECLQTKIKCKNEENSKLENQISERKNELEKLRKSVNTSCEREEKVKNNINMLRNSRTISEGLLMSMKQQLRILEEKRNETKNVRKNIIEKYSKLFESHKKIYSNLPWVKKINELKISIKSKQINLDILKLEYSSAKRKISFFHRIQDKRKVIAITRLAKCLVERNNLQKEVESLFRKQKELQSKITLLEEDKIKLQERIDLKVKEALDEARGRVVKKHVGESSSEKNTIIAGYSSGISSGGDMVPYFNTCLKPANESIFSRLGLSVPPSMKRLLTPSSRVLSRVNSQMEEHSPKKDAAVTDKISAVQEKTFTAEVQRDHQKIEGRIRVSERTHVPKEDHSKKKDTPEADKFYRAEERSQTPETKKDKQKVEGKGLYSSSQALKRSSTSFSNISEKIPHLMEVTQKSKATAVENVISEQERIQSMEKEIRPSNEKTELIQTLNDSEPARKDNLTSQTEKNENKRNMGQTIKKHLMNIIKTDSNSESTLSVQVSENPKSDPQINDKNVIASEEEQLRENENEASDNLPEKHVTFVIASQEIPTEKEVQPQKQVPRHIEPPEAATQEKIIMNEIEMNDSNLSVLDNISVVSSTFTNENRNQMAKSPDFLNQIPQGYCFSPLYSPSKADSISEVSSVKGAKSPSNSFPITSIASPLFSMNTQPAAGPSSDFSSFFGTSSPKKSENSSKNFFQLFG